MRLAFILASCLVLSGCFFFLFPIPRGETFYGNTCVATSAAVGGNIWNADGKMGTIKTIYGASDRCRKDASHPVLAEVVYEEGKK